MPRAPWTATPCARPSVPGAASRQLRHGTSQAGARFVRHDGAGSASASSPARRVPIGADAVVIQEETSAAATPDQLSREALQARRQHPQGRRRLSRAATSCCPPAAARRRATQPRRRRGQQSLTVTRRPAHRHPRHRRRAGAARHATGPRPDRRFEPLRPRRAARPLRAERILDLGIVADDAAKLDAKLLEAFDAGVDVLVTTGGASVGERDYVQEVLKDLGVTLDFWKLRMRPGKPLMFGTRGRTWCSACRATRSPPWSRRHRDPEAGAPRAARPRGSALAAHRRADPGAACPPTARAATTCAAPSAVTRWASCR